MENSDLIRAFRENPKRLMEIVKEVKRRRNIEELERVWELDDNEWLEIEELKDPIESGEFDIDNDSLEVDE
tara:strand:+ start:1366 stop:1578 length:213 start_codon:yes stop_codon:yes gene_type:complete